MVHGLQRVHKVAGYLLSFLVTALELPVNRLMRMVFPLNSSVVSYLYTPLVRFLNDRLHLPQAAEPLLAVAKDSLTSRLRTAAVPLIARRLPGQLAYALRRIYAPTFWRPMYEGRTRPQEDQKSMQDWLSMCLLNSFQFQKLGQTELPALEMTVGHHQIAFVLENRRRRKLPYSKPFFYATANILGLLTTDIDDVDVARILKEKKLDALVEMVREALPKDVDAIASPLATHSGIRLLWAFYSPKSLLVPNQEIALTVAVCAQKMFNYHFDSLCAAWELFVGASAIRLSPKSTEPRWIDVSPLSRAAANTAHLVQPTERADVMIIGSEKALQRAVDSLQEIVSFLGDVKRKVEKFADANHLDETSQSSAEKVSEYLAALKGAVFTQEHMSSYGIQHDDEPLVSQGLSFELARDDMNEYGPSNRIRGLAFMSTLNLYVRACLVDAYVVACALLLMRNVPSTSTTTGVLAARTFQLFCLAQCARAVGIVGVVSLGTKPWATPLLRCFNVLFLLDWKTSTRFSQLARRLTLATALWIPKRIALVSRDGSVNDAEAFAAAMQGSAIGGALGAAVGGGAAVAGGWGAAATGAAILGGGVVLGAAGFSAALIAAGVFAMFCGETGMG